MSFTSSLVFLCFVILMLMGAFVVVFALTRLAQHGKGAGSSKFIIPLPGGKKIEVDGPAWLMVIALGALMIGSPVLAAFAQKSDTTAPPTTVQRVQESERLPEENLDAFTFIRDLSVLDLRQSQSRSWSSLTRAVFSEEERKKIKPAVLRNIMLVRKIKPVATMILTYSTSGSLVVRCLTQPATYLEKFIKRDDKTTNLWALTVDVSAMPLNQNFEVIVEATYYNGFSAPSGSDFSTYGNQQTQEEELSLAILFPESKPMSSITVKEFPPTGGSGGNFSGTSREFRDPAGLTYYWTTTNSRSNFYYTFSWSW